MIMRVANRGQNSIFDIEVSCFEAAITDLRHSHRNNKIIKQLNFTN